MVKVSYKFVLPQNVDYHPNLNNNVSVFSFYSLEAKEQAGISS